MNIQRFSAEQAKRLDYLLNDEWVVLDDSMESGENAVASRQNLARALGRVQDPAEIHYFARNFNWDGGHEVLELILSHPLTSKATLLMVYWMAGPGYYMQFEHIDQIAEYGRKRLAFIQRLDAVLKEKGANDAGAIQFDPKSDEGYDWTARYAAQMRKPAERKFRSVYEIPDVFFYAV